MPTVQVDDEAPPKLVVVADTMKEFCHPPGRLPWEHLIDQQDECLSVIEADLKHESPQWCLHLYADVSPELSTGVQNRFPPAGQPPKVYERFVPTIPDPFRCDRV